MMIAILPRMPDEDTLGPKTRDRETGSAFASAFEGEMKGAEGRARPISDAPKPDEAGVEAAEATELSANDEGARSETDGPGAVLSLLAAVSQTADNASRTARTDAGATARTQAAQARPHSEDDGRNAGGGPEPLTRERLGVEPRALRADTPGEKGVALASPSNLADVADRAGRDIPRSRLVVAHQETHFEPVAGEAVLVEIDEAGARPATRADRSSGTGDLARLLDVRSSRPTPDPAGPGLPEAPTESPSSDGTTVRPGLSNAAKDVAALPLAAIGEGARSIDRRAAPGGPARATPALRADTDGPATLDDLAPVPAEGAGGDTATPDVPTPRRSGGSADRSALFLAAASEQRAEGSALREGDRFSMPIVVGPSGAPTSAGNAPAVSAQVAERIIDAFGGPSSNRPVDEAPTSSHLRLRAGGAALKTLTIQLQPENLGLLHVSMRLHEGQLMLEIAADKAETARMLTEDRASLRSLLEKAGFSLDDAAIVVAVRETGPASATTGSRDGAAHPDGRGAERGGGQWSGEGERGRSDGGPRPEAARRPSEEVAAARPKPGGTTFL